MKKTLTATAFVALNLLACGLCLSSQAQTSIGPQCSSIQPPSPVSNIPVADFKASAKEMVHQLLKKGYRKFGQLDLNEFLQEIEQTNVNYVPALKFNQADGSERSSACWELLRGSRTINVSLWQWARTEPSVRPVIAMHEFVGPAGFNDQDYQLTTAMAVLETDESAGLLEPEQIPALHHLIRSARPSVHAHGGVAANPHASGGGGIVGVGGGGDWLGSMAKLAFIQAGLDDLKHARTPEERREAIQEILEADTGWKVEATWR